MGIWLLGRSPPLALQAAGEDPAGQPPEAADPLAPEPASAEIRFMLTKAEGKPGSIVKLKLSLITNTPLSSIDVAINFEESILRLERAERAFSPPASPLDDVAKTNVDNRDEIPGDQIKEGWIYLQLAASETAGALKWPLGEEVPVYEFDFRILEESKEGFSPVVFAKVGSDSPEGQFENVAAVQNGAPEPARIEIPKEDLLDGGVIILGLGEIGFFLRADTNLDHNRDISDPIRTLTFLFYGETNLLCLDAADANDDGTLDLSDAVYTLYWLYASGSPPPEPDSWGPDPTRDSLCCEDTGGCS